MQLEFQIHKSLLAIFWLKWIKQLNILNGLHLMYILSSYLNIFGSIFLYLVDIIIYGLHFHLGHLVLLSGPDQRFR